MAGGFRLQTFTISDGCRDRNVRVARLFYRSRESFWHVKRLLVGRQPIWGIGVKGTIHKITETVLLQCERLSCWCDIRVTQHGWCVVSSKTSLCSASYVSCKRGTARICCCVLLRRRPCSNRSISPTRRTHSSKPAE